MPKIIHLIKINSTPEEVYKAITTLKGLSSWWTGHVTEDTKILYFGFPPSSSKTVNV